jgi:hypothetical protein
MNESNLAKRYFNSTGAFWLAEAGIAQSMSDLSQEVVNDCIADSERCFSATITGPSCTGGFCYFEINSTGTSKGIQRIVRAIVRTTQVDASSFQYAIETEGALDIGGSAEIEPEGSVKEGSSLDFESIFGSSVQRIKSYATVYDVDDFPNGPGDEVSGVNWVVVPEGEKLKISSSSWEGSGILIVEGDLRITGGTFEGIIYVMGNLQAAAGNPEIEGAVMIENGAEDSSKIRGNVTISYDLEEIGEALNLLQYFTPVAVSWQEM